LKTRTSRLAWLLALLPCFAAAAPAEECTMAQSAPAGAIRIKAVGDMVLGSDWPAPRFDAGIEQRFFAGVRDALGGADIVFGNLEGNLARSGSTSKDMSRGTQFAFRMPPEFGKVIKDAGFTALNLANNHTLDFGAEAYEETVRNVARLGIATVGLKDDIAYQEVKGRKVAWVGFSYITRHNQIQDTATAAALVKKARQKADIVIVSFHGGAEGSNALRARDGSEEFLGESRGNVVRFARTVVDAGADLVLGHGPHVLRGVECYRGRLIAYSLGNFVGYQALSSKRAAGVSAILEVGLDERGALAGFRFLPVRFTAEKLPEPDPDRLGVFLLNELSALPPLGGARLLGKEDLASPQYARYRAWMRDENLDAALSP
jgi:hypothetical protein